MKRVTTIVIAMVALVAQVKAEVYNGMITVPERPSENGGWLGTEVTQDQAIASNLLATVSTAWQSWTTRGKVTVLGGKQLLYQCVGETAKPPNCVYVASPPNGLDECARWDHTFTLKWLPYGTPCPPPNITYSYWLTDRPNTGFIPYAWWITNWPAGTPCGSTANAVTETCIIAFHARCFQTPNVAPTWHTPSGAYLFY